MTRQIAIIGAGPSGLTAAKAALEVGLEPTIFEAANSMGGLWKAPGGYVWNNMRTNLSKWTCAFSDHPWDDEAEDFPLGSALLQYILGYATRFQVDKRVVYGQRVTRLERQGAKWLVSTGGGGASQPFDGVIVAGGVFARPSIPQLPGLDRFAGQRMHSGQYRDGSSLYGKHVVVVGGGVSGVDVAGNLAACGAEVTMLFGQPCWVLPRFVPFGKRGTIPLDLLLYRRGTRTIESDGDLAESNRNTAISFERTFGNPGDADPALRIEIDSRPPYIAISDNFLEFAKAGAIKPIRERTTGFYEGGVITAADRKVPADAVVFCTGYDADLQLLSDEDKRAIEFDPADKLMSHIAHRAVVAPALENLYFVGHYRGVYFGAMELQARWAAGLLAGAVAPPSPAAIAAGLDAERAIRARKPRPQYPYDYVPLSDGLAGELGIRPLDESDRTVHKAVTQGPMIPAHYRLSGPGADRAVAMRQIHSACARVGLQL